MNNIKNKTISGLAWKFSERITAQLVTFVVSAVLARVLSPADYGVIAIVNVFIAIANVFVDSGFGNSLIQKKNADNVDFSSVFYFNIVMSLAVYFVLYLIAPYISSFYNKEILTPVLRVLGFRLVIAGINSVQHAYVSKKMIFKRFFWSTLFGTVLSAAVGIVMAYNGFGVWSLVGQYMTNTTVDTIVLWFTVRWRPSLAFSFKKLKGLFSYGWKILVTSLIDTTFFKLRQLLIGKMYTSEDLAFYSKGDHFPSLVVTNVNSSIRAVLFPAMSNSQDKKEAVKAMARRSIRTSSYIMFPMMMGLAVLAEPIVKIILTDKWLPCVPFLQICCCVYAFMPLDTANLQAIKAMGRSDIILKLQIIKKTISVIILLISIRYGVLAVALSNIFTCFITSFTNAFPNKKLLKYSYLEQIKDITPSVLISVCMGIVVYISSKLFAGLMPILPAMIIEIIIGVLVYFILSEIFKIDSYVYIKETAKEYINNKKGDNVC